MKIRIVKFFLKLILITIPLFALLFFLKIERTHGYAMSFGNDVVFMSSTSVVIGLFILSVIFIMSDKKTFSIIIFILCFILVATSLVSVSLFQVFVIKFSTAMQNYLVYSLISLYSLIILMMAVDVSIFGGGKHEKN